MDWSQIAHQTCQDIKLARPSLTKDVNDTRESVQWPLFLFVSKLCSVGTNSVKPLTVGDVANLFGK